MDSIKIIVLVVLITSCVSPVDIDILSNPPELVIQGQINTEPGPYTVWISQTLEYLSSTDNTIYVDDAIVTIHSVSGITERLQLIGDGKYLSSPNGIRGVYGESYFLTVEVNGKVYRSSIQKIEPVATLDSVAFEVNNRLVNKGNNVTGDEPFITFYSYFQDPPDKNFYLWNWQATKEIRSFPELHPSDTGDVIEPLECSSFPSGPCYCCQCWFTFDQSNSLNVLNDQYINGNYVSKYEILTLPLTNQYFDQKTYFKFIQQSLNEDSFQFWNTIKRQKESASTLFAVPSSTIKGNIQNINDPNEQVWGNFNASGTSVFDLFIDVSQLGYFVPIDSLKNDCTVVPGNTIQKPSFWVD